MRSVGVSSPVKVQQDELQPKSDVKAGLHHVRSSLSLFNARSSTSVRHLQCPSLTTPMPKRSTSEHHALPTKSKPSTIGSELVLVSTTLSSVNHISDMEMSSALGCLPLLADWEDVALLPASQPEQSVNCAPPIGGPHSDTLFSSGERSLVLQESERLSQEDPAGTEQIPQHSEPSKSIVYKSPHTTVYSVQGAKGPAPHVSDFKLPECRSSFSCLKARVSHPSALGTHLHPLGGTKRKPPSPSTFPPAKIQTFTIHEEKPTSSDGSPVTRSSQKVLPSILTSTVNLPEPWKSRKMTPPLCRCGRRAKRLVVSNNGPNHGRVFYCCPVGKHQENRKCCGFFKWEQTLERERASHAVPPPSSRGLAFSSAETSSLSDRNLHVSTKTSLRLRPSMRN